MNLKNKSEQTLKQIQSHSINNGVLEDSNDITAHNHESHNSSESSKQITTEKPFTVNVEINLIAFILFIIAFAFRFWRLDSPRSIVFDELHYGKYVSLYLKGIFFFDSQPPLGKQLIALCAYFAGYDGENAFNNIGGTYENSVPLKALRFIPALFGSLIVPIVYQLMLEIGLSHKTAALASIFIILDNALLTQSRFILMEMILMFFSLLGILCCIKSRKKRTFSVEWYSMLLFSSLFVTFGVCVKYVGVFALLLAVWITLCDFWKKIADQSIKTIYLWIELLFYTLNFIVIPIFIYSVIFYIHLSLLTNAGPHDNIMTSAFQASLEGGLASITRGQPLEIAHGSQITLRHTHGRACWLHSHQSVYPVRYADNRGSSHQQQVTCYSFKDVNNWWIVKRPEINELVISEPLDRIKDGEVIQLIHGMSGRALNSHDVAAPVSPQNQEVSCYIDYNISMPAQSLWMVKLLNNDETNGVWHTINSRIRLIHVNSTQALKFSGKQLPDWGFHQHEVVTDKVVNQDDSVWNVEEHRYTKNSDAKERERELGLAEFVPLKPTHLSFWDKMVELQYKMLIVNQENIQDHIYSCDSPLDWLLMTKGIAYWISPSSNAQIHLIGNVYLWYIASLSIVIYLSLLVFYLMRRARNVYDISEDQWTKYVRIGQILAFGYFVYYIPYFLSERTLFLHHYLPALIFKLLLSAALFEFISYFISLQMFFSLLIIMFSLILYTFIKFLPLSYGTLELSANDVLNLKWKETWQLIVHKQ